MLGDPRLKNGLTYYPGVSTSQGVVCLGNVVRLSLQAEDGQSYTGYGHLKGLWLWRDQPYIRVQHFAPVQPRAPRTAVAYRADPEEGEHLEELLVTTSVADHRLDALLGPVTIEDGPLSAQLFQRNVSASCQRFQCSRHLDLTAQRAAPLDADSRLTPLVQHFSEDALMNAARGGEDEPEDAASPAKSKSGSAKPDTRLYTKSPAEEALEELKLPSKPFAMGTMEGLMSGSKAESVQGPSGKIYQSTSLVCLKVHHLPRKAAIWVLETRWFDPFILITILCNCSTMAWESPIDPENTSKSEFIDYCEWAYLYIFTFELVSKIIAYGFLLNDEAYLKDPWCQLDFVVVSLAWIPILIPSFGNYSVIRSIRALRPLRALKRMPGMPALVSSILASLPALASVAGLCAFVFIVFGIVGMELFKGSMHYRCAEPGYVEPPGHPELGRRMLEEVHASGMRMLRGAVDGELLQPPRDRVAERLLEAVVRAAVVHRALEELHADDAKDEEDKRAERRDVAHLREGRHDRRDEHGHPRHALQRAQRAQRAHRADHRVVAEAGEEDRQPRERHDRDVELAPRVGEVGGRVAADRQEAVGEDLREHLEREDDQVHPLAHRDEVGLVCAARVERRLPPHRAAVADDGDEDDRIERLRLDEEDRAAPRLVAWLQEEQSSALIDALLAHDLFGPLRQRPVEPLQPTDDLLLFELEHRHVVEGTSLGYLRRTGRPAVGGH